jgi:hypothetical protein
MTRVFRYGTAGKEVIMDGLSVQTVARDGICLFLNRSILLVDEGQYKILMQKALRQLSHMFHKQRALVSLVK